MGKITKASSKKITWIDINHPSRKDLAFLTSKFKVEKEHLEASLPSQHAQRPNVILANSYTFLAVLFPIYNHDTRSIEPAEVDVFITSDHLITIHDQRIKMLNRFYSSISAGEGQAAIDLAKKPSFLFYELLDYLYHDLFPKLDNMHRDIKRIQGRIFSGDQKELIREILIVKSNILSFKRIMQAHRSMIKKMLKIEHRVLGNTKELQFHFNELLEHVKDVWSILDTYMESIESLENTSNAIIDQRMNRIVTTLTIVTVLLFPFSLLGGIFGMNALNMPIIGEPYDFWILLGIMAGLSFAMFIFFKKKRLM